MKVIFINENTLGHASHLPRYAEWFRQHPEAGIEPAILDVSPFPSKWHQWAGRSIPLLRRWGLDLRDLRWRLAASRSAAQRVAGSADSFAAVVANTQSVALNLIEVIGKRPLFVSLDATFQQLLASPWFDASPLGRYTVPLTGYPLLKRERRLYANATRLLPWSEQARRSLITDYGFCPEKTSRLPPALMLPRIPSRPKHARPQILFVGGDFYRKNGPLLLDCFRRHFAENCELHLLTHSPVKEEKNVHVYRHLVRDTEPWLQRWREADLFVFPSRLETFGIALIEALAFELPVISSDTGAAREILADGRAGWILPELTSEALRKQIDQVLHHPVEARNKARAGRARIRERYDLDRCARRLAGWLREEASP